MEDLTGTQLGTYRIVGRLGQGGMATVFRAYQPGMERYVAIKVLPRQLAEVPEFIARFRQEARVLANLQHPHILPVFDFGESEGYTYLVMPYAESGTLADLLTGKPFELSRIKRIVSQIGDALDYAHGQGLIHRDVKPSNILVDERENCLLTDFGIAKMFETTSRLTATGGILGTPAYMSPEQGQGNPVDNRTDIYSLGVVLYEMATGRPPYRAETPIAVIFKHIHDPLPLPRSVNPTLPEPVELVILKALAKLPEDRFSRASKMVEAIQTPIAAPMSTSSSAKPPPLPPTKTSKVVRASLPRWVQLVGTLILIIAVGVVWILYSGGSRRVADVVSTPQLSDTQIVADLASFQPSSTPFPSSTPTDTSTVLSIIQPTETATSTKQPSPIPTGTATPTLEPTATKTAAPTATPSCAPATGTFSDVWTAVQVEIGCPSGQVVSGLIVEEDFQFGKMLWREPIDFAQAVVLFNNGNWQIFQHAPFVEGSPEYPCEDGNTPAQSPPTPRRGFGAMWCDIPAIRNGLGNATNEERGYSGLMQHFDHGFMVYTDYGTTYVFYSSGQWQGK